jgi:hypothetical protein
MVKLKTAIGSPVTLSRKPPDERELFGKLLDVQHATVVFHIGGLIGGTAWWRSTTCRSRSRARVRDLTAARAKRQDDAVEPDLA